MYTLDYQIVLWGKFCIQLFKSITLSATHEIYVTKGEIESTFLNTPTKEPNLKDRVNTTMKLDGVGPIDNRPSTN